MVVVQLVKALSYKPESRGFDYSLTRGVSQKVKTAGDTLATFMC
jgi:hypothetical protein